MTLRVPYMPDDAIERDAEALLAQYAHARGVEIRAADPDRGHRREAPQASRRVRRSAPAARCAAQRARLGPGHLRRDLARQRQNRHRRKPRSRGATRRWKGAIVSRLRTRAADIGGCIAVSSGPIAAKSALFADAPRPTVICRSSQAKERVEWQADFYASCLLMPRRLVHAEWQDRLGRTKPLLLSDLRPNGRVMSRAETLDSRTGQRRGRCGGRRAVRERRRANRTPLRGLACRHAHPARKARAAASSRTNAAVA